MDKRRLPIDKTTTSKLECPVCFEIPREKIFQCANGHSICDKCSIQLTNCPTCRSPGVRIRNLLAESFLDDIKFTCSWSQQGCDKVILRRELAAHENQCDHNPNSLKICSVFIQGISCPFKLTSKWLADPENCFEFMNHIKSCHNAISTENLQYGKHYGVILPWDAIQMMYLNPSILAHQYLNPTLYRYQTPNQNKLQLYFVVVLLRYDKLGNRIVSFGLVQLTPETGTSIQMQVLINGSPKPNMSAQWGPNSLPALSWTQKPIVINKFVDMVKKSQHGTDSDVPFPCSIPVSFLAEYYKRGDGHLYVDISFGQAL